MLRSRLFSSFSFWSALLFRSRLFSSFVFRLSLILRSVLLTIFIFIIAAVIVIALVIVVALITRSALALASIFFAYTFYIDNDVWVFTIFTFKNEVHEVCNTIEGNTSTSDKATWVFGSYVEDNVFTCVLVCNFSLLAEECNNSFKYAFRFFAFLCLSFHDFS